MNEPAAQRLADHASAGSDDSRESIVRALHAAMMPSDVNNRVSIFDKFADAVGSAVSKAWFFTFCVVLVVLWCPSFLILPSIDTWQLVINTLTTIITFLLVALIQNQETRSNSAVQQKLNALVVAMCAMYGDSPIDRAGGDAMDQADGFGQQDDGRRAVRDELNASLGVEQRESS